VNNSQKIANSVTYFLWIFTDNITLRPCQRSQQTYLWAGLWLHTVNTRVYNVTCKHKMGSLFGLTYSSPDGTHFHIKLSNTNFISNLSQWFCN